MSAGNFPQGNASVLARLGVIRRLIEFIQGADLAAFLELFERFNQQQLGELLSAIRQLLEATQWTGADGRAAAGLKLARLAARISETDADDQLLAAIEAILQNVGVLNALAAQCEHAASGQPLALSADDQTTYEAAGFDIGRIIALINLLLELFRDRA